MLLALIIALSINEVNAKGHWVTNYYTIGSDTAAVLTMADVMPEIKGGLQEVYKHIKYPTKARSEGIEGRVFVKFIVDEQGNVKEPTVLKDIGGGCGDAAIEGISKVKFKPGEQGGEPVSVYFTLPITFKLEN